jgi:hypothetical protein
MCGNQEHVEEEVTAVLASIVGDIELQLEPEAAAARAAAGDEEVSLGHLTAVLRSLAGGLPTKPC